MKPTGIMIYCYTNRINGKKYVGQTMDPERRQKQHMRAKGKGSIFHTSIRKHGYDTFTFEMLDFATNQEEADCLETYYIRELNTLAPNGYNLKEEGKGSRMSEETRDKMKIAMIGKNVGKTHSQKTRDLISLKLKGKSHTQEHRAAVSAAKKGETRSPEHRAAVSAAQKGKTISQDHRDKISKADKGKPSPMKGKHHSSESRELLRKAFTGKNNPNYGKPLSKQTRDKISESLKGKMKGKSKFPVQTILQKIEQGVSRSEVMDEYKISQTHLNRIIKQSKGDK